LFDEPAPAFGRFRVTAALGDGRFGLVHLGVDPETDQVVVIRTFTGRFTDEQQKKLLDALARLCARPLDHESVATPFACGVDHGVPYLVHTYLPGTSVDEFLRAHGPRPLSDVIVRVAHLAGALDFAAAAGVYHGSLSPRDIIFGSQSTGVAGFGLVQAMHEAGADVSAPLRSDDIYALAAMTFELLVGYRYTGGNIRDALAPLRGVSGVDFDALVSALEPVLAATDPGEWPETALGFAGSLHAAQLPTEGPHTTASRPSAAEIGRLSFGLDDAEASAVTPAVPVVPPAEPPVAAVGEMSIDATLHSTPEEAPY
jgi:serine/threonine protein kinase